VVKAGGFDLQASLMGARVLREDVENHLRSVEHPHLELAFEVSLLARAEVVVADNDVECALSAHLAKLVDLAHPNEMRRVHPTPSLDV